MTCPLANLDLEFEIVPGVQTPYCHSSQELLEARRGVEEEEEEEEEKVGGWGGRRMLILECGRAEENPSWDSDDLPT